MDYFEKSRMRLTKTNSNDYGLRQADETVTYRWRLLKCLFFVVFFFFGVRGFWLEVSVFLFSYVKCFFKIRRCMYSIFIYDAHCEYIYRYRYDIYIYIFQHFMLRWNLLQCVLFGGSCMVSFLCILDWTNIRGAIWSQGWLGSVWILILIRWEVSPCLVCSPWHERHSRPPYRVWMGCFRNYVKMGNITATHRRVQVELRLITFWVNCWNDVRWWKSLKRI